MDNLRTPINLIEIFDLDLSDPSCIITSYYYVNKNKFRDKEAIIKILETDPSLYKNHAIIWASDLGEVYLVNELLKDDRVDPSDQKNIAITLAIKKGHLDIVKLLLKDERINPFFRGDFLIKKARNCKNIEKYLRKIETFDKIIKSFIKSNYTDDKFRNLLRVSKKYYGWGHKILKNEWERRVDIYVNIKLAIDYIPNDVLWNITKF